MEMGDPMEAKPGAGISEINSPSGLFVFSLLPTPGSDTKPEGRYTGKIDSTLVGSSVFEGVSVGGLVVFVG